MPLLPEIPPHKPKTAGNSANGSSSLLDGGESSGAGTKIALRTEEEQQAAAREREERERAALEKEIKDRREARRKSLANRRVSFAAEATLHTFHEVEYAQDSTTSTDSTRRASSVAAPSSAPQPGSDASEPPSTPPEQAEDLVSESPAHQRDLHQRRHRRSSGAASMNYDDDDTITSTVYDSDADDVTEIQGEEMTDSSDSDSDDGTMMTVEAEEMTSASVASMHSAFSADSSGDLDVNLRLAAQRAVTQQIDDEEEVIAGFAGWGRKNPSAENLTLEVNKASNSAQDPGSEMEMEMDTEMDIDMDITSAVGGILRQPAPASPEKGAEEKEEMEMDMSMDMTKPMGGIISKPPKRRKSIKPSQPQPSEEEEEEVMEMDMSMDVTRALGGIISQPPKRRKSIKPSQSHPSQDVTSFGEQTMEFTMAIGGIQHGRVSDASQLGMDSNEDMSMELTTAVGAVLAKALPTATDSRRESIGGDDENAEESMMEMTMAVGRILPQETPAEEEDETMGMDMTMAVGGIMKSSSAAETRSAAKRVMEQEVNEPDPSITASAEILSSPQRAAPAAAAEDSGPAAIPAQGRGLRRSLPRAVSPAARAPGTSPARTPSPKRNARSNTRTPTKTKTPPAMIGSRSSSPVRHVSPTANATPRSPSKSPSKAKKLFRQDPSTGVSTPRVVLTPQGRQFSGVGADRPGLGSPRVAEIFDRRESLGDAATNFIPGQPGRRGVAFASPRVMEAEIDKERIDEEEKENSRRILQQEADGGQDDREATLNLREMIQGLSPKKNFLRGRKSLHVGSARGLLGKRPAELEEEDGEDQDGVKRLKGHQGSPVKNVKLPSPPSKVETTTGRKTRSGPQGADSTITDIITPTTAPSPTRASSPRSHGRFKNITDDQPTNTMNFDYTATIDEAALQQDPDGDRIHLQDFLNMTSIRFMELTTTKRRHTIAPSAPRHSSASDTKDDASLERCVVAGACTVPMLELYQHVSLFLFRKH